MQQIAEVFVQLYTIQGRLLEQPIPNTSQSDGQETETSFGADFFESQEYHGSLQYDSRFK